MTHQMVVGTSEPQDFQLLDDGVALVGTGFDVAIVFRRPPGGTPTVEWLNQAVGTVRVSGVDEMTVGSHYFRFHLTDSGGGDGYVPNLDPANLWMVSPV